MDDVGKRKWVKKSETEKTKEISYTSVVTK